MKISFATTCMGRLQHIQETLPQNIRDNPSLTGTDIEFVVLNYSDRTGMDEWMKTDSFIREKIEDGTIRYAHYPEAEKFHMAHAKNMAHRLATGDVVCNLDADNFTGKSFGEFLARIFEKDINSIVHPDLRLGDNSAPEDRGYSGRIAVSRENFLNIGGYDEKFSGWGGDDSDFRRRAKGYGLHAVQFQAGAYLGVIQHSNNERVSNMDENALKLLSERVDRNKRRSLGDKLSVVFSGVSAPVQSNEGSDFGCGRILTGLEGVPERLDPVKTSKLPAAWVSAFGAIEMIKGRLHPTIADPADESLNRRHPA